MKRKLNERDVPEVTKDATSNTISATPSDSFASFGLDPRILKGIQKQKFSNPTAVQSKVIPLALGGRDVLARSGTGTGKTAAYILPILQSILKKKSNSRSTKQTSALILVPTVELASQVTKVIEGFAVGCGHELRAENICKGDEQVQKVLLSDFPDVVVATPSRASVHVTNSTLSLSNLAHLVIDEADRVISYNYEDDLQSVKTLLPPGVQTILMSATLDTDVEKLKGDFCTNPAIVEMDDPSKSAEQVRQHVVKCAEDEKFLIFYAIFILHLLRGKFIVFVADIDRCYRLKLFLEQFGVKSCVLNSELPVNSRIHVVEEFNKNVYDIILATDEHEVLGDEGQPRRRSQNKDETENEEVEKDEGEGERPKKKSKSAKRDKEYGVSRGIDFKNVGCVINFDLPTTSKSYTHRIGRTARAGKAGMALSFVIPKEQYRKHKPTSIPSTEHDEEVLEKVMRHQEKKGFKVEPWQFDMKQLEGLRGRSADMVKAVTRKAIRDARIRELEDELKKSEKLKRHFEENPEDLQHLRHDTNLKTARVQPHLKHLPDYLLPPGARKALTQDVGFVGFNKDEKRIRGTRSGRGRKFGKGGFNKRKTDPLKSFGAKPRH